MANVVQTWGEGRVSVIILNYNNYADTVECVDGILDADFLDIVLVDNSSPDGSGERLRSRYSDEANVSYIQSGENRGYAAGNNVGIMYAFEDLKDEYICVLNNDTLPRATMFRQLAEYLHSHLACGIVSPVILENKPGSLIQSAGANIDLRNGDVSLWHYGETYEPSDTAVKVPYASGACLMFRASDYKKLGPIPECYFLFYEETEWCLHAERSGLDVVCLWGASLVHKGSASVSNLGPLSRYLMVRNRALFEKRNASPADFKHFFRSTLVHIYARHYIKQQDCLWEASALRDGAEDRVREEFQFIRGCDLL